SARLSCRSADGVSAVPFRTTGHDRGRQGARRRMVTRLLDANVLIALFDTNHVHHAAVHSWFRGMQEAPYATCPVVEGALARWIFRLVEHDPARICREELGKIAADPRHRFWPDDVSYADMKYAGLLGHRQVTD